MRSEKIYILGIVILLLLITSTTICAQNNERDTYSSGLWMNISSGMTGGKNYYGMGGLFGIQYSSRSGLLGIRYLGSYRATVDPATILGNRLRGSREMSVTYGIEKRYSMIYLSASTGLGVMWGTDQMAGSDKHFNVATIPIEFQGVVRFGRIVGVGGILSTSINSRKTLTSAMIVLQVGSLNQ
jgi:hypothetical protein